MGMLYEYEGFDNLFDTGNLVFIDAEYERPSRNGHMVRIKWYPEAIDNDGQIKIVDADTIIPGYDNIPDAFFTTKLKSGSKIQLRVEYVAYHREDYHIICIDGTCSGKDDMIIHKSLFYIPEEIESNIPFVEQIINHNRQMTNAYEFLIKKLAS